MAPLHPDVTAALASLQTRWGAAAPRLAGDVVGALATVPLAAEPVSAPDVPGERIVRTGFADLDAILGPGGVPRSASVALRGSGSSGRTTVALRLAAQAQANGAIVAWLDLSRSLDPVEAVARGVRLEWLVVLTPETLDEGLSMAGSLLAARAVDLLLVDLPARRTRDGTSATVDDRLRRLAALARRTDTLLVVLEPPTLDRRLAAAVADATGLRLELTHRAWIRLGRDVVGQRTEVTVARNRFGPPGRRAELRILYADGQERDACLRHESLLADAPTTLPSRDHDDATSPPLLAAPSARPRPGPPALRLVADRADRPRRPTLDGRDGRRSRPRGPGARGASGDAARLRPPAGA